jgi:hypothetical protein
MVGSLSEVTRETRRCWWAKRTNSPRAWLAGVRASVVAMKRVMTVEPRDAGRWKCRKTGRRKRKPTRVPARASQWWNQPSAIGLGDPEGLSDELGDRAKSRSLSRENPPTGKPDAGDPPVRFGGRGGAHHAIPTPIVGGSAEMRPCRGGTERRQGGRKSSPSDPPARGWNPGASRPEEHRGQRERLANANPAVGLLAFAGWTKPCGSLRVARDSRYRLCRLLRAGLQVLALEELTRPNLKSKRHLCSSRGRPNPNKRGTPKTR